MRLKSLELQGFKSFPNKTVLNFDNGLTVVVGPNGSGKSNISDAIRWVLGELSSKSIRGKSMQDVIFKGTSQRSAMTFAEVTLTFDNTVGVSRLPIESDEVSITRRYYRTGDSEYQINRKPARLKDIVALLLNTGLGKSGYSMINQGKTTEIISAKSDERRHIFEEAAGISGYRASKDEAEKKMKQAEENLRVVEAKYDMLREQIIPLEREAERAKKYLELSAQRKQADVSLWLYDMEKIRVHLEQLERDCAAAKQELDLSESSITSFNRQIEELQQKLTAGKLRMEELQESIRTYDHAKSSLESSSAGLQKELEYSTAQIATSEADLRAQRTLQAERTARNTELAQILEAEQIQHRELLMECTALSEERLPAANEALDAAENAVDDNVQSVEEMEDRFTQNQIQLASITTSEGSASSQLQALAQRKQALENAISDRRGRLQTEEAALADLLRRKEEIEGGIATCNTNIATLEARYRALTEEMTTLRVALNTNRGKVDTLRRMDELFDGYANSVRAVMEAAGNGMLTEIIAPVSKLFTVEERYVIAIETAIGANIQNIVVENEEAAKCAIAYLKKKHAGRATFYPLTSIRPQFLNLRDIDPEDYRGYLGVATEFVTSEERYQNILAYLLGKTLIFDTIENATEFAKANKFHTRIVTLDGQVINAGGSFTGGSVRESGILSRSNNIAHMEEEIKKQEARMAEITKEDHAIVAEISENRTLRGELEEKQSILLPTLRGREVQVQVERDGIEQLESQLREQTEQFDIITRESDDLQLSIVRLRKENEELEQSIATARDAHDGLVTAAAERRKERDAMQESLHQLRLQIAVKEKEVEAAQNAYDLGAADAASIQMQIDKLVGQITTAQAHIADATASLEKNRTDAAGKDSEIAAMQQEWERLRDDCDSFEKRQNQLRAEVEEKRTSRESVIARYSELNAKCEQMKRDQEKETAKITELYSLTYGTALELGYPPVTEENYKAVKAIQTECTHKLRALGSVNTNAVDQYREVKEKFDATEEQLKDVESFKKELLDIITNMEDKMRTLFLDTFHKINGHFGVVFERLFGAGGRAELSLSDPDNVLESGIEIHVAPPGKIITNLSLLSGGEQSCVAIALLFAILQVSPSPFCVLDEVEAALDEENVRRVAEYAKEYSETIQMIMISHRRGTMEAADVLYGVTMAEQGITTVLSVNANEVEKKLGVKF